MKIAVCADDGEVLFTGASTLDGEDDERESATPPRPSGVYPLVADEELLEDVDAEWTKLVRRASRQAPLPPVFRILVALGFDAQSESALDWALAVGDACGAHIDVLHAWTPARTPDSIFSETLEGMKLIERIVTAELEHPAAVSCVIGRGEPAEAILEVLAMERYDLVIVGCGGDHCGEGVTATVAAESPCEVVVVCPHGWHGHVNKVQPLARTLPTLPAPPFDDVDRPLSSAGSAGRA
jgi:hypothetical protein